MEEIINLIREIKDKLTSIEDLLAKTNNQGGLITKWPIKDVETSKNKTATINATLVRQEPTPTPTRYIKSNDFEALKDLLNSNEWPDAVPEFQMVDQNSEEEKMDRAEGIVDILVQENLPEKKFLDFGCGEGHMAKYASKDCSVSVGYDIIKPEKSKFNWENKEDKFLLTTDFQKVKEEGPYDIIMIYDVIDHAEGNTEEILIKAKSVLKDDGKIYLRTHPWCGRHGSHLYRQINKAFVHLVFTEDELDKLGYKLEEKNIKVLYPVANYGSIIKKSGLKSNEPDVENNSVEDFFKNTKIISDRLKKLISTNKESNGTIAFPEHQMKQCFHDYILTK
jgi:2-polyprenyl-3-methyl-5-hydroxy-6-metoxy-1,4-benzoquinol methylase